MKNIKFLIIITLSVVLFGCSTVKVTTDSEKSTNFSQYKTYSFLGWQKNSDQVMSEFDRKHMRDAFKNEFDKRNLKFVKEGGDISISLFIVVNKETSTTAYTNYYGGYGGRYRRYGRGWGTGYATTTYSENDYLKGTLVMDVFDEKSGDMVWQGVAVKTIPENAEKRKKSITKTVEALMAKFPVNQAE